MGKEKLLNQTNPPKKKYEMVTNSAIRNGNETKLPQIAQAITALPKINTPPKVGVPFFFL